MIFEDLSDMHRQIPPILFSGNLCIDPGMMRIMPLIFALIYDNISDRGVNTVKIVINTDPSYKDIEIVINCPALTPETEGIISALRIMDSQITVIKNGESFIVDISKIVYIESVDRKTFVYTEDEVYETKMKLYEMEERLCGSGFFRISKSCLVQLRSIRSIRSEFERKLRLTLENGEQMIVSRQYADELKTRLGVR